MQKFKAVVNKGNKQYTFVFSASSMNEAREKMHKEGYTILSVSEFLEEHVKGNVFLFEIEKNSEIKQGKAMGKDIFKVYLNLRKNLGYKILKLYKEIDKDLGEEYHKKILKELEDEYQIYILNNQKKEDNNKIKESIPQEEGFDNFYLKKDLEETYKLIDFILLKLQDVIDGKEIKNINSNDLIRLKNIYNSIVKIKNSTNISKLKEIGELALIKIGKLEKLYLEKQENEEIRKLLKQTNILLKRIGSKEQIIEDKKNISLILKQSIKKIINFLSNKGKNNKIKKKYDSIEDKESYYYIKNERLIKLYKEKLKINRIFLLKNIFNSKKYSEGLLRRNVIKQNITLLKAKKKGIFYSYTKVKKGYDHILKMYIDVIEDIRTNLFYIIIIYTLLFIFYINFSFYIKDFNNIIDMDYLNFKGILYFIFILFIYLLLYLSRTFTTIIINLFLLFLIIIVGIINF